MFNRLLYISLFLLLIIIPTTAQDSTDSACSEFVIDALIKVDEECSGIKRNQVCYGHDLVDVFPTDDSFTKSGDTLDISQFSTLTTAPLDVSTGVWGVAIMSLQASLETAGQNVTFVIFGDVSITSSTTSQAYQFTTGIGQLQCAEAPKNGLLIQAPQDTVVTFRFNGVDIEVGSTGLLLIDEDDQLNVNTFDGSLVVTSGGVSQTIEPGYQVSVDENTAPFSKVGILRWEAIAGEVSLLG